MDAAEWDTFVTEASRLALYARRAPSGLWGVVCAPLAESENPESEPTLPLLPRSADGVPDRLMSGGPHSARGAERDRGGRPAVPCPSCPSRTRTPTAYRGIGEAHEPPAPGAPKADVGAEVDRLAGLHEAQRELGWSRGSIRRGSPRAGGVAGASRASSVSGSQTERAAGRGEGAVGGGDGPGGRHRAAGGDLELSHDHVLGVDVETRCPGWRPATGAAPSGATGHRSSSGAAST